MKKPRIIGVEKPISGNCLGCDLRGLYLNNCEKLCSSLHIIKFKYEEEEEEEEEEEVKINTGTVLLEPDFPQKITLVQAVGKVRLLETYYKCSDCGKIISKKDFDSVVFEQDNHQCFKSKGFAVFVCKECSNPIDQFIKLKKGTIIDI